MIGQCPQCGAEIQATVPVYLTDVLLDSEGTVVHFALDFTWDEEHGGAFAWDHSAVTFHCKNDHEIHWNAIGKSLPRIALIEPTT